MDGLGGVRRGLAAALLALLVVGTTACGGSGGEAEQTPDSEEEHVLYLNVTITFEKNTSDARVSQGAEKVGMKYGLKAAGIEARELKDFYRFGDTSEFYLLEKDGNPVGNLFFARQGKRIYTLVMSGMYFNDAATWKDLIEEKLTRFAAHAPD